MRKFCIHPAHTNMHLSIKSSISALIFSQITCQNNVCQRISHYIDRRLMRCTVGLSVTIIWVYGHTIAGLDHGRMGFLLSVKDLNILTEMTCLLYRFQGLCMAHTTLYIQKNAYYIQIFTLCNCIMYISTLTCRQRVTHKLVSDGPERNTVTDLNDCL